MTYARHTQRLQVANRSYVEEELRKVRRAEKPDRPSVAYDLPPGLGVKRKRSEIMIIFFKKRSTVTLLPIIHQVAPK